MSRRRIYGGEFFGDGDFVKLFVPESVPMPADIADEIVVNTNDSSASDDEQGREFVVAAEMLKQSSPVFASMLEEKTWKESSTERIHLTNGFHPDDFRVFLESLALIQPLSGAPINEVTQHELAVFACRTPKFLRQVLPIAHYYQAALLKEAIFSSVLSEKSLCKMKPVDATELVFTTEASLPEEEVPEWPVRVLKLLLDGVLKRTTTDSSPKVGNTWKQRQDQTFLIKENRIDRDQSAPVPVRLTTTATKSQSLQFDIRMKELSTKTIIKMMTSIDIKVTSSIQVDVKAVAELELQHIRHPSLGVSTESKLSKMTLLTELSDE